MKILQYSGQSTKKKRGRVLVCWKNPAHIKTCGRHLDWK
jgi:hypothetical protein